MSFYHIQVNGNPVLCAHEPFPTTTAILTAPYLIVVGELIKQVMHYLFNCGTTTNFVSDSLVKDLDLIPMS